MCCSGLTWYSSSDLRTSSSLPWMCPTAPWPSSPPPIGSAFATIRTPRNGFGSGMPTCASAAPCTMTPSPASTRRRWTRACTAGLVGGDVRHLCDTATGWISSMVAPILKDWTGLKDLTFSADHPMFRRYLRQLRGVCARRAGQVRHQPLYPHRRAQLLLRACWGPREPTWPCSTSRRWFSRPSTWPTSSTSGCRARSSTASPPCTAARAATWPSGCAAVSSPRASTPST